MSQISSLQILRDHMTLSPRNASKQLNIGAEVTILTVAAGFGITCYLANVEGQVSAIAGLLTATSILTGLTFTLALRFWERSLDARSNVDLIFDDERKRVLDYMRTSLLWTVLSGVVSTGWLAGVLLLIGVGPAAAWATALAAGLVSYQLLNVVRSLLSLYKASYSLRP